MSEVTTYGDITARLAGLAWRDLLERITQMLFLERTAEVRVLPTNSTKTIILRRFNTLSVSTVPLAEGRTPPARKITVTDIPVTVEQHGTIVRITDQVKDTHPDPVISEYSDILSQNMAETQETLNYNIVKAGTAVIYANNVATRADVQTVITRGELRKAERTLANNNAKKFNDILVGTTKIGTEPIAATYWAVTHPDLINDLKNVTGFTETHEYASSMMGVMGEVGNAESFRFVTGTIYDSFADSGNATGAGTSFISTTGAVNDVYPIICFGKRAWSTIPLKGANSGTIIVLNPKPVPGDELGQRGSISYKFYHAGVITQDLWMQRIEVAATLNPS
jgi:N4-gp56 family major capsid protein